MTFFVTAQCTAFHHGTFRFIAARFVHHCMLKQALTLTNKTQKNFRSVANP